MIAVLWKWVLSLLVWLSADTSQIEREPARCAAAVAVARAAVVYSDDHVDSAESVEAQPKGGTPNTCQSGTCPPRVQ